MSNSNATVEYYTAENFMLTGKANVDMNFANNLPIGTLLDVRYKMLCFNPDISIGDLTWYKNYLATVNRFASKSDINQRMLNLLSIGYIPAVYMPAVSDDELTGIGRAITDVLDAMDIPHLNMQPTSFIKRRVEVTGVDVWVNKMDLAPILNMAPETITCSALIDMLSSKLNGR